MDNDPYMAGIYDEPSAFLDFAMLYRRIAKSFSRFQRRDYASFVVIYSWVEQNSYQCKQKSWRWHDNTIEENQEIGLEIEGLVNSHTRIHNEFSPFLLSWTKLIVFGLLSIDEKKEERELIPISRGHRVVNLSCTLDSSAKTLPPIDS